MIPHPKVDQFLARTQRWRAEIEKLRTIVSIDPLQEDLKWGQPCYTLENRNVVLIHGFTNYCALLFFKGALMEDPNQLLIRQTENVQSARQIRFTSLQQIVELAPSLKAYIQNAIAVEKSGAKVTPKKNAEYPIPAEFLSRLAENPDLKAAFDALTPGRQRAYLLYFSSAKQSKTREARIEKCVPKILSGIGLDDR